jgi:hypothetical protein
VSRAFGHNFNADQRWDRLFIDEIHRRDEDGLDSGELTPTQMIAVMENGSEPTLAKDRGRKPEEFIRTCLDPTSILPAITVPPYEWHIVGRTLPTSSRLADVEDRIQEQRHKLHQELLERMG